LFFMHCIEEYILLRFGFGAEKTRGGQF